eukprot:4183042-Prymnesium_polylepis.2
MAWMGTGGSGGGRGDGTTPNRTRFPAGAGLAQGIGRCAVATRAARAAKAARAAGRSRRERRVRVYTALACPPTKRARAPQQQKERRGASQGETSAVPPTPNEERTCSKLPSLCVTNSGPPESPEHESLSAVRAHTMQPVIAEVP